MISTLRPAAAAAFLMMVQLAAAASLSAQQPTDTTRIVPLPAVVATADRGAWPLMGSVAAVSRFTAADFVTQPTLTVADALRLIPGIALVDMSGDGFAPQPIVRGFYGGGEAEYMVVLLNGKPINDVHAGLVRWDVIPLAAIESIEVVRGGISALYGDAALGAVVNVITRAPGTASPARVTLAGGSDGAVRGSAHVGTRLLGRDFGVFGGIDRSEGFRSHAERTVGSLGADFSLLDGQKGRLTLSALGHWRDLQDPGALLGSDLATDRTASDVLHRFDGTDEASQRISLQGERRIGDGALLSASLTGDNRDSEIVRTIALAPGFADTKERDLNTRQASASVQLGVENALFGDDRLTFGVDGSSGDVDSEYYAILTGVRPQYEGATGARGALDASGAGHRSAAAAFAQYILVPTSALRISAGIRADWLEDEFEPTGGQRVSASHTAWSPKAGVNLRWLSSATQNGNVYATAGRSFKAPTLDQLFDQRSIPVAPGFSITTSNPLLDPQHGINVEGGLYHSATLVPGALAGEISLAVYQMDMENELDFDLQTFRYVNLGESRHRGVEAGARLEGPRATSAFLNYTLQHATKRNGENAGNFLKAIPRQVLSAGVGISPLAALEVGFQASHSRDIYLDDANTIEHPDYTRVDARLAYTLPVRSGGLGLFLDVRNLFDAEFSTTGFPDSSGSGAIYYYPAAGRTLDLGIRLLD